MIVSDKLVFIHMHKTGGQFILSALLNHVRDSRLIAYHRPRKYLPTKYQDLPLLGSVRNPWDWYVSWYFFNQQKKGRTNPLYAVMSDAGSNDYVATIRNMTHFGEQSEESRRRLSELRKILPETMDGNRGIGLTKSCLEGVEGSFYSWQFRRMFSDELGNLDGIYFARQENLRVDFLNILERIGVAVSRELRNFVETSERPNRSTHEQYSNYYDDDLRTLIENSEQLFIKKFGYTF